MHILGMPTVDPLSRSAGEVSISRVHLVRLIDMIELWVITNVGKTNLENRLRIRPAGVLEQC
jgi:hypothetical protein